VLGNNNSDIHGLTEGRCWKMKQHKRKWHGNGEERAHHTSGNRN
jgi:hypothetical protein